MKTSVRALLLALILLLTAGPAAAQYVGSASINVQDEGVGQGLVRTLNCVGSAVTCAVSGAVGTLTVTGGAAMSQTTIDFATCGQGAGPGYLICKATISDASVSASSKILVTVAGPGAGRNADEAQMDELACTAAPASGSFELTCFSLSGATHSTWLISYAIGAGVRAPPQAPTGRLTLESGVPYSLTNQTAKTTVYFTPYRGNTITLWDGAAWQAVTFAEVSVAVPSTTNTNFDIFGALSSGALVLETVNWSADTTRATAITLTDGVYTKSGDKTRLYLGTGRTTGTSGKTAFYPLQRAVGEDCQQFIWNYFHRGHLFLRKYNATESHGYTGTSYREWNGDSNTNLIEVVIGVLEDEIFVTMEPYMTGDSGMSLGVSINSVSSPIIHFAWPTGATARWAMVGPAIATGFIAAAGYHKFIATEISFGGSTATAYNYNMQTFTTY